MCASRVSGVLLACVVAGHAAQQRHDKLLSDDLWLLRPQRCDLLRDLPPLLLVRQRSGGADGAQVAILQRVGCQLVNQKDVDHVSMYLLHRVHIATC